MDAIAVKPHVVNFLQPEGKLYLHCIDFEFTCDFNLRDLPFMSLNLVGGHVSFIHNAGERRIAMFANVAKILDLSEELSPIIIQISTCYEVEVSSMVLDLWFWLYIVLLLP